MKNIKEFEKILDSAEKKIGDQKRLFVEVAFLQENFANNGISKRLIELLAYAKEFEIQQHLRRAESNSVVSVVNNIGMPLSRRERRALKYGNSSLRRKRK